jgi:hypothetical protein
LPMPRQLFLEMHLTIGGDLNSESGAEDMKWRRRIQ